MTRERSVGGNGVQAGELLVPIEALHELGGVSAPPARQTAVTSLLLGRKLSLAMAAVAGLAAAWLLSYLQTPVYQARLSMEILPRNERFLRTDEVTPIASGGGFSAFEADMATLVKVLQSRALFESAIHRLGPPGAANVASPEAQADALNVRAVRTTRIIEATFESTDSAVSAGFLNALSDAFIAYSLDRTAATRSETLRRLSGELETMKRQLRAAEIHLRKYSKAAALVYADDHTSVEQQHLVRLEQELSVGAGERIQREAEYESTVRDPSAPPPGAISHTFAQLSLRRADLVQRMAELRAVFTDAHPDLRKLQAQLAQANSAIEQQREVELSRVRTKYETARRREELLRDSFAVQARVVSAESGRAIEYDMLRRQVDTNRSLYEELLRRVQQARIASMTDFANVRVIDAAIPPATPVRPQRALQAGAGLLLGLLAGSAFIVARERTRSSLRNPGDLTACTGLPELGSIPDASKLSDNLAAIAPGSRASSELPFDTRAGPQSLIADHVRAILTSILFSEMDADDGVRRIVVSSPNPGDGKSTLVSNLALALADIHRRVLVIDADFRKPRMHEIFRLPNQWGLSNLLIERARRGGVEGAVERSDSWAIQTAIDDLRLLPAGTAGLQAVNLLYDSTMRELLELADKEFDFILIDTPPLEGMADARILAKMGAKVILVARAGETAPESLRAAAERLAQDGTPILGTVLNAWDVASDPYARGKYRELRRGASG